jgi:coproporphyrinogen III oxidase/oxygen-independent coproporphyrinogen-3 oxidase
MKFSSDPRLLNKYDIPAPRYTSYPTVPYWKNSPSVPEWMGFLEKALQKTSTGISLYIHIPFCETLCTFCGCNTSITKNHEAVEGPYLGALEAEWNQYKKLVPRLKDVEIQDLHLGGGTPTYFSDQNLEKLCKILGLDKISMKQKEHSEFSIEVDPRRTSRSQLEILYSFGFRRISLGVQDFDPEVQRLVNRIQPFEYTESITEMGRNLGFHSVNFDLIYGLPKQTEESIQRSMELTLRLKPDRIAFYSYAHVPWIKASQRLFTESDLPVGDKKRKLYEIGRSYLEAAGYKEIGMDHFALPNDSLWKASQDGKLHRNFMGYTTKKTDVLLGLGTSAISETPDCFHQNEKLESKYRARLKSSEFPSFRGHILSESDKLHRGLVLNFMTQGKVSVPEEMEKDCKEYLSEMESDQLIQWNKNILQITEKGKPFLRIACTAFDQRFREQKPTGSIFSKAI